MFWQVLLAKPSDSIFLPSHKQLSTFSKKKKEKLVPGWRKQGSFRTQSWRRLANPGRRVCAAAMPAVSRSSRCTSSPIRPLSSSRWATARRACSRRRPRSSRRRSGRPGPCRAAEGSIGGWIRSWASGTQSMSWGARSPGLRRLGFACGISSCAWGLASFSSLGLGLGLDLEREEEVGIKARAWIWREGEREIRVLGA